MKAFGKGKGESENCCGRQWKASGRKFGRFVEAFFPHNVRATSDLPPKNLLALNMGMPPQWYLSCILDKAI